MITEYRFFLSLGNLLNTRKALFPSSLQVNPIQIFLVESLSKNERGQDEHSNPQPETLSCSHTPRRDCISPALFIPSISCNNISKPILCDIGNATANALTFQNGSLLFLRSSVVGTTQLLGVTYEPC